MLLSYTGSISCGCVLVKGSFRLLFVFGMAKRTLYHLPFSVSLLSVPPIAIISQSEVFSSSATSVQCVQIKGMSVRVLGDDKRKHYISFPVPIENKKNSTKTYPSTDLYVEAQRRNTPYSWILFLCGTNKLRPIQFSLICVHILLYIFRSCSHLRFCCFALATDACVC